MASRLHRFGGDRNPRTDGGSPDPPTDENGAYPHAVDASVTVSDGISAFTSDGKSSTLPIGIGAIIGVLVGGLVGLVFGPYGLVAGCVAGGFLGNEIERRMAGAGAASSHRPAWVGKPRSWSMDLILDVLKNRRRRHTLEYVLNNGGPVELSDLAEHVAAQENDTTVEDLSSAERKRVYTSLYQTHLPKLDDAGIVAYDQSHGIVTPIDGSDGHEP